MNYSRLLLSCVAATLVACANPQRQALTKTAALSAKAILSERAKLPAAAKPTPVIAGAMISASLTAIAAKTKQTSATLPSPRCVVVSPPSNAAIPTTTARWMDAGLLYPDQAGFLRPPNPSSVPPSPYPSVAVMASPMAMPGEAGSAARERRARWSVRRTGPMLWIRWPLP